MNVQERIRNQVAADTVVLYMKGMPQSPQCGFSGATVQLLRACGVTDFTAVDVLADPEIRDGIKVYSNWPTVPQLYVSGEFVGGADIVREMYSQGELQKLIDSALA
ncbi:Grx4 family monothiol glutaredoxin [Polaromonas sp.]|uniref:Grx4 family monothiol glutaredoxin n=1 Tax=Polaromonas sp. TaxID=1869339 RepID=UPI0035662FBD